LKENSLVKASLSWSSVCDDREKRREEGRHTVLSKPVSLRMTTENLKRQKYYCSGPCRKDFGQSRHLEKSRIVFHTEIPNRMEILQVAEISHASEIRNRPSKFIVGKNPEIYQQKHS